MTGPLLLLKAHNKGYRKKDGTFVKPFDDSRPSAKAKPKGGGFKMPQFGLFHDSSHWPFKNSKVAQKHEVKPTTYHPQADEHGKKVGIFHPSKPTDEATWTDPEAVATFVPGGDVPAELNGVPFRAWRDHPRTADGWDYVDGQMDDLDEPGMKLPAGKQPASGVIIEEPDGRVWVVHPTNGFAGYDATFPKGGAERELSLQANAIKEAFEESGLQVQITGYAGDFERGTTLARYYHAKRVGGSPTAMGWESQAVSLVPKDQLLDLLNGKADQPVAIAAGAPKPKSVGAESAHDWEEVGGQLGSNPGGFYIDPEGGEWYCKFPKSASHAKNEILASKLYHALGVKAPHMKLIARDGKTGVASQLMPVLVKDPEALKKGTAKGAREGFAIDAWLANWDSVGLAFDNMLVDEHGDAVRLDPGGSMLYRARGEPKGSAFGDHVGEIDSLRSGTNKQAAEVFGKVTDKQIRAGVQRIAALPDSTIHELVDQYGPGNAKEKLALGDRLIARKRDLVARFLKPT